MRALRRGLAAALVAPAAVLFLVRGLGYPLVTDDPADAWGGPTMAGAWAVHALVGALTLAVAVLVASPLLRERRRPGRSQQARGVGSLDGV